MGGSTTSPKDYITRIIDYYYLAVVLNSFDSLKSSSANNGRFDALLDGMYEIIPDDQIPDEYKDSLNYLRFFPSVKVSDRDKLDKHMKFLDDMVGLITWGFGVGTINPEGLPVQGFISGISIGGRGPRYNPSGSSLILIAPDIVEPLMNPASLPTDKALDSFLLASVILHEITVRHSP